MKSTDKFVLVLVASLFLLIAGCGGGGGSSSPTTTPPDDDDGMTMTPIECDDGYEPNAANDACVKTAATLAAEAVAATKAAATKTKAIAAEAAQGPGQTPDNSDAGLGGSGRTDADGTTTDTDTSDDVYGLSIKRDAEGVTTVEITDPDMAADDDPKFTQAMDLGSGRTMHTRTMEADDDGDVVEETVIVSTDIQAAKATEFAKVDGQALNGDEDGVSATGSDAIALLVVDAGIANVKSSEFSSNGSGTITYAIDDATTTDDDEAFEAEGTYNGASGTYRCAGTTPCTVAYNAMGMITAVTGGWIFTPDAGATSDVPDADYLHYGVWIQKTTDEDGVVTYNEVETFAGSSIAASGATTTVLGSATYEGGATGVYVHEVKNPAGNIDSATSGHFTADVMLTATFGQVTVDGTDTIADNLLQKISGTINNFMLSGHNEGPGWSVTLQGDITDSAGTASGTAEGRKDVGDGSFSATFYGDVTAVGGTVPKPGSVAGEFNSVFSNGSVAGAFGAREQAE